MSPAKHNTRVREAIALVAALVLVSACSGTRGVAPKRDSTSVHLDAASAVRLVEVKRIAPDPADAADTDSASPVVALAFAPNDAELTSAHYTGRVRTIDWQAGKVVANLTLTYLSAMATEFDDAGSVLVTAAGNLPTASMYATLEEVQAWRMRDGRALLKSVPTFRSQAIAVSLDGQLVWEGFGSEAYLNDIANDKRRDELFSMWEETTEDHTIDALAIDNQKQYLAAVTRSGKLAIGGFGANTVAQYQDRSKMPYYIDAAKGKYALALKFDPLGDRLAMLTTHNVLVFNLKLRSMQHVFTLIKPINMGKLAFNADGTLLVLASDNGVQILDVAHMREIKTLYTGPTYALAFNHAQTRIAFGDAKGTVHVWGMPTS